MMSLTFEFTESRVHFSTMDLFLARETSHESLPKLESLPENQLRHELGDRIMEVLLDLFTHGEGTSHAPLTFIDY